MQYLGLDIGTSGSRAALIDENGVVLDSATVEHLPFDSPQIGWAEQSPEDWWQAATAAIRIRRIVVKI